MAITKGQGEFELYETLNYEGDLHVSFYSASDGKGIGGVYFASAATSAKPASDNTARPDEGAQSTGKQLSDVPTPLLPTTTAEPAKIPFVLGAKSFKDGDSITITEVKATSPDLKVGDKVIVKGHYTLASEPKASLCLFVTATSGSGRSATRPEQRMAITKGQGDFELSKTLDCEGYLHVSFYPAAGGGSFGGVYFESAATSTKPASDNTAK